MNINSTPTLTNQAQSAATGQDALSLLGDQLLMDPTIQALLQDNADSKGMDFETLLENTQTDEQKAALMKEIGIEVEGEQEVLFKNPKTTQVQPQLINGQQQELKSELQEVQPVQQIQGKKQNSELASVLNPKGDTQEVAKSELGQEIEAKRPHVQTSMFKTEAIKEHQAMAGKVPEVQATEAQVVKSQAAEVPATKAQVVKSQAAEVSVTKAQVAEVQMAKAQIVKVQEAPVEIKQMDTAVKEATALPKEGKLLDLNQFMAKQSNSNKMKAANKNGAYKATQKSIFNVGGKFKDASVQNTQPAKTGEIINLQDAILGKQEAASSQMDQGLTKQEFAMNKQNMINNAAPSKVLDMSQVNMNGTTDEVITKIQDYIIQSKASNQKSVQLSFTHQDLGKTDLLVQKGDANAVNITIASNTAEASRFFSRNQGELLASLSSAGVQVSDMKLETSSNRQSFSQNQNQSGSHQNDHGQHSSQSGQRQEESQKRQELWELMQDKEVA